MDPGRKRRAVRRLWTAVAAAFAPPLSMPACSGNQKLSSGWNGRWSQSGHG
ncbi:hypothetical protein [Streptomyces sp. B21-083]|uniref:hypothetical protein n=1 Tax=Streptomyces sp. B21-083 TaxID=3039410 RepID=UPI002FEEBF62